MSRTEATSIAAGATPSPADRARHVGPLVGTGLLAAVAAAAATSAVGALARAAGVDFIVARGEEAIPLSGIAFVTGVFSVVGVAIAAALFRWSTRPARRFVQTAGLLTAISLAPPVLVDADGPTTATLIGLHLIAAAVVIPALTRSLRTRGG